jgi:chromate transporter
LGPVAFDMPVPASLDPAALLLTAAAILAIFRFRLGPLPVLAGCAVAGLAWYALAGAPVPSS